MKSPLRLAVGSDHGGFELKQQLIPHLVSLGHKVHDCGTHSKEAVDYPTFAAAVAREVASGRCDLGIMIDGAGIGSCMVLNRIAGIRAALCHNAFTVVNSRAHNDANVLVLGSNVVHQGEAARLARLWLRTPFEGGRHARRVEKINALDRGR